MFEKVQSDEFASKNEELEAVRLLDVAADFVDDFEIYEGYSGSGMYGRKSLAAFTTSLGPNTNQGKSIQGLGFTVDNLGLDYIYYLK